MTIDLVAHPLEGVRIGITAGPTQAWIDPVRYLANASSGALGALLADRLAELGADVTAIFGPGSFLPENPNVNLHFIETPQELIETIKSFRQPPDMHPHCWIHSMAVLDFVPESTSIQKITSDQPELSLRLVPTPKVIRLFKEWFPNADLVGFKLLTDEDPGTLLAAAESLARDSHCDLVVANPSPFKDPNRHSAYLYDATTGSWQGPRVSKTCIEQGVSEWILGRPYANSSSRRT